MKKILMIVLLAVLALVLYNIFPIGNTGAQEFETSKNDFDSVEIETDNSKIEIYPTNGNTAKVEFTGNKKKYNLDAKVSGDTLLIELDNKWFQWFSIDFSFKSPVLKVYLPEQAYQNLKVNTDNGMILVSDLQVEKISVEADNGKIDLKNLISSSVEVESNNGAITLDHVQGMISGNTNNGIITLVTDSIDRDIQLQTNNGRIKIQTETEPTNVTYDLDVDNGRISVFGETNYEKVIGNGDNLITLSTNNGEIVIEK